MNSQTQSKFSVQQALFYSQITFGLSAARILKSMAMLAKRKLNPTEEYLVRFTQAEMVLSAAKIWDSHAAALNIEKFVKSAPLPVAEIAELLAEANRIKIKHQEIIKHLTVLRNNLGAHLNKGIAAKGQLPDLPGEVSAIQKMLNDVKLLIESMTNFPSDRRVKILDYDTISNDLRL